MKRFLLLGLMALFLNLTAQCQKGKETIDIEVNASDLLNRSAYYGLSSEQKDAILKRKKMVGREFSTISKSHVLTGEQKGQKKRELAQVFKQDIDSILDEAQREKWNRFIDSIPLREQAKKDIEVQLKVLEEEYKKDLKRIEDEYQHDDTMRKAEKKARKERYKTKKSDLEKQKDLL
ncbi:hypothetical protein [Sphingobacterium sp. SYP-B4668]|uniref:hypothetical protein n=1 Tax=Sphingobacterium sp. SYP-B4668 TaxID=2996035 RepID=UPI0022DD680D|nr:hypothetical protein [Sphingobacterium sp. SYP-B4668]